MKTGRAILSGALIWVLVFSLFGVLDFIPVTHDSQLLQGLIAGVLIIPFALLGASTYYKSKNRSNGLTVGLVMVTTALLLDVIITVPLVEKPYHGRDHYHFFTDPLLWIIATETVLLIYLYFRIKISKA